jgi:hypothetical protein
MVRDKITADITDLLNTCGGPGWRRVAFFNMTDPSQQCPLGLNLTSHPIRTCGSSHHEINNCSSTIFSVSGQAYKGVCGRIKAYQFGRTEAFTMPTNLNGAIDVSYVEGLSLTHGGI